MIAPLDARHLLDVLEVIEHVRIGDREIDALQIDQIADVADRAVADDWQHAQVVAIVQRLAEIGGIAHERSFEQAAREPHGPVVDARRPQGLLFRYRLWRHRLRPFRSDDGLALHLGNLEGLPLLLSLNISRPD